MRNLLIFSVLTFVLAFGFTQNSMAQGCTDDGPFMGGPGRIIDCIAPLRLTIINTGTVPATTGGPNGDDQVNIADLGGVTVSDAMPAINTSIGDDEVNISGFITNDMGLGLLTSGGNDTVTMNGNAQVSGSTAINLSAGDDTFTMNDGTITATATGITTGGGADMLTFNDGTITAPTAVTASGDSDFVIINGGTFNGNISTGGSADTLRVRGGNFNGSILGSGGNDNFLFQGGTYNGITINSQGDPDTINIAADIPNIGTINCGNGPGPGQPIDTLIFSQTVDAGQLPILQAEIAAAGEDGTITINAVDYSWINCENLVSNLNGIVTVITLTPVGAVNPVFTDHTVTATVIQDAVPAPGIFLTIEVLEGPNAGLISFSDGTCSPNPDCSTDANGQVSWTYTGDGGPGTDMIFAFFDGPISSFGSNIAEAEWVRPMNVPTLSEWGLIAMAALLGIVGFMVIRRRQVAA